MLLPLPALLRVSELLLSLLILSLAAADLRLPPLSASLLPPFVVPLLPSPSLFGRPLLHALPPFAARPLRVLSSLAVLLLVAPVDAAPRPPPAFLLLLLFAAPVLAAAPPLSPVQASLSPAALFCPSPPLPFVSVQLLLFSSLLPVVASPLQPPPLPFDASPPLSHAEHARSSLAPQP